MNRKHRTDQLRDTIGALHFQRTAVKDIKSLLAKDEAGLGYPVDISERMIRYHQTAYREIHGAPTTESKPGQREALDKLEDRIIDLAARELTALEGKRRGSMTKERWALLKQMKATIHTWRRQEASATGKLKQRDITPGARPHRPADEPQETAVEKLAREEREAKTSRPTPVENAEEKAHRLAAEIGREADAVQEATA